MQRNSVSVAVETITPSQAQNMLARARNMRTLRYAWVRDIARAIVEGRWELNGETIKIDPEGYVVDGQHRLHAAVLADTPITAAVARDVGGDVYVDIGHSRSAGQLLHASGVSNANSVAAAVRVVWYYYEGPGLFYSSGGGKGSPDRGELLETYNKYPGIDRSVDIARDTTRFLPRSVGSFIHFVGARESGDPEMADMFMEALATGQGVSDKDGPYLLRERIIRDQAARKRVRRLDLIYLTIRAWNAWIDGERLSRLLMAKGNSTARTGEGFPRVSGGKGVA